MLRYYYLTWFSQPASDRVLYQALANRSLRSVVEIGLGTGVRTKRLFEMAVKPEHAETPLLYTGIDLFEGRPAQQPGLKLRNAFKELKTPHVRLDLVPGDPYYALDRKSHALHDTDLVIISADQQLNRESPAWRLLGRIIHAQSLIFWEQPTKSGETKFEQLKPLDVERLATAQSRRRKAA